jgi:hypothetical protein
LESIYGKEGELQVLSGSFDRTPYGIIVTDYFADSLLNASSSYISKSEDKYEILTTTNDPIVYRYIINAVIDTDYEDRYSWIFEQFEKINKYPSQTAQYIDDIRKNKITYNFVQEVNNYLSIAYTFNSNFIEDTLENPNKTCLIHYFENLEITNDNLEVLRSQEIQYITPDNTFSTGNKVLDIADNEIYLSVELYNEIYGTTLTLKNQTEFKEKYITLNLYTSGRKLGDKPKVSKRLLVKGLLPYSSLIASAVSDNTFRELRRIDMSAYALYAFGGTNKAPLYLEAEGLNYKGSSEYIEIIQSICKILEVFKDIFGILLIGLCIISIFILSSYILRNILSYKRELGIIRAIGGRNKDSSAPFIIASILIGLISAIISSVGFYLICTKANSLIVRGFAFNFAIPELAELSLISFSPVILIIDLLILFGIIGLTSIVPIIAMKRIKPIDIMRRD